MTTKILPGVVMESPGGAGNRIVNFKFSGATPVAATETVLDGSQIVLPAGGLQVGTRILWTVSLTKTAAGTSHTDFKIKSNTGLVVAVGTTGGAATMATFTGDTETAAADTAEWNIEMVVTAVNATTGAIKATLVASNALSVTGFFSVGVRSQFVAGTSLDTSADILSVGLSITTGTADAVTVNYVRAEATELSATGV